MKNANGLPWMGLAVGLSAAATGVLWLGLARMTGQDPGALAILAGFTLLALVMAGRCGRLALARSRVPVGRCRACGTSRHEGAACPRCGTA
ncbi:MAG: hypothetical protein ACYTG2_09095 [Planctomycetota bacterium]|jgi:hypothetical protein